MKKAGLIIVYILLCISGFAQDTTCKKEDRGEFSGNFQTNNQFYQRDERIGANTTQYLHEKSSTDAWLMMTYKLKGFNFMLRYDMFNNSPLFNPQQAYSNQGIGFWQVSKDIDKINITVGYFYDQFATGMVFRAYEDRNIGIDFAIAGARVIYNYSENTRLKAFTGKQKWRFDVREPIIKGVNIEHNIKLSETTSTEVGGSIVNRTLDQNTMNSVAALINSYPLADRFNPTYNVYAWNVYNTLKIQPFTIYLEYLQKTPEAIMNLDNVLERKGGNVYYGSVSYSSKGIGVNAQYKRIASFPFRTSPLENQPSPNNAPVNYLPSITRQNTYRLLARYNAVVQEIGENAAQLEVTLKPTKKTIINLNGSIVNKLAGVGERGFLFDSTNRLFSEGYVDISHKFSNSFKVMVGLQHINYNQEVFEAKASAPFVTAITPFGEITYRVTRTSSFRFEWQYMHTNQDLGSFVNGLIEFNMAPHWSFAAGDLLNFKPGALNTPTVGKFEQVHYFTFFSSYTYKTTRVTVAYLKQPQGVNCTGGVCRVEPAFSGGRITLSTNF